MDLQVGKWQEFAIGRLFELQAGKINNASALEDGTDCEYFGAKWNDNAFMKPCKYNAKLVNKGNCIMFITDGQGSVGYALYKDDREFMGTINLVMGYSAFLNPVIGMFLATVICRERERYSFGRKWKKTLAQTVIKLPIQHTEDGTPVIDSQKTYSNEGYLPDWQFMEDYIQSLHSKPLTTRVTGEDVPELRTETWEGFCLGQVFDVQYGINMELNACKETTPDDPEGIAFVARTAENNGVSAYVKPVRGKIPQKAGTITCAGGGSVLSTFVQDRDFYSGRDLYLLHTKEPLSLKIKLFLVTIITIMAP
ncbi:restriction endonuclease subunit S [uncultured Selenomonas sp.]|uniref:restriction endonuclease subunit S n=1 Tax=uncultured Selenomonas sp. TaxID=159275 RepID=UPI0025DA6726|nr:restriction endonuclease subunit S [uncultured Selenomonas sp.]